ncbi:MAG: hypothetical protein P1R74_15035, partial [Sedimenticola sp.]|nr:hypothetical protein [Sedimenticola sp.]
MLILLINDTDGRENIGCRLTSHELKQNITDKLRDEGVHAHIMPAPWLFKKTLNIRLALRLAASPKGRLSHGLLEALVRCEYGSAALESLALADCVVFQPEGTVNDNDDAVRILRILSLPLYA